MNEHYHMPIPDQTVGGGNCSSTILFGEIYKVERVILQFSHIMLKEFSLNIGANQEFSQKFSDKLFSLKEQSVWELVTGTFEGELNFITSTFAGEFICEIAKIARQFRFYKEKFKGQQRQKVLGERLSTSLLLPLRRGRNYVIKSSTY